MKILVASSMYPDALERLRTRHDVVSALNATEDELCARISDREALIFRSGVHITEKVMSCAPDLALLIRAGSGLDNLDLDYARRRSIELFRIPEPSAQAVAELAFGLMLTLARQIRVADEQLRQGHWTKQTTAGYLLRGKVLGIIGVGNIGSRVAELGMAWGMETLGHKRVMSPEHTERLRRKGIQLTTFEEVLRRADFVSLHVPLKESTHHLVGAEALGLMKPGAFLVNMARGGVVDERALHEALLRGGPPAGAGLDVHESEGEGRISPLAGLPNVVLTPHIGATTVDTQREIGERILEIVGTFATRRSGT